MNDLYVFDACSLIVVLSNEKGTHVVKSLLQTATNGEIKILMHKVNFLEVYYYIYKKYQVKVTAQYNLNRHPQNEDSG